VSWIAAGPENLGALARSLAPTLHAIAVTAGPNGRTCLLDQGARIEQAENALAVVRALAEQRGPARLGARLLREILFEANRDLGDGTARLALLWGGLIEHGANAIVAGVSAPTLVNALTTLGERLSAGLEAERSGLSPGEAQLTAAAVSAGASPPVGRAIARMLLAVGQDGGLDIVAGQQPGLHMETGEGFRFEAVPVSRSLSQADLDPAYLLVADERIDTFGPLVPLLEGFATRGKALLVVARDVSGEALQALIRNHRENSLRVSALRPAAASQHAADILEDLAIATGATLVAERFGTTVAALRPGMLGRCERYSFSRGFAVLHAPEGDPEAVAARRRLLLAEATKQKYLALDRARLELRAGRLTGRWGRLEIGGLTQWETATITRSAGRALASAHAAAAGGVLPGGGVGLVRSFDKMPIDWAIASDEAFRLAHHCLGAAIADLVRALNGKAGNGKAGNGPSGEPRPRAHRIRAGSLGETLGLPPDCGEGDRGCVDALPLMRQLVDRAVSGAAAVLRLGVMTGD
jgi:chaperonin GroEL